MHELAIAQNLIETAVAALPEVADARVTALRVQLGALAGISKAELRFGFDVVSAGTPLAGARLEIEEIPAVIDCPHCQARFLLADSDYPVCPICGATAVGVVQGKELTLMSIEVRDVAAGA
jgi:hydrogenase nickel incorporation protein HypA/HybF